MLRVESISVNSVYYRVGNRKLNTLYINRSKGIIDLFILWSMENATITLNSCYFQIHIRHFVGLVNLFFNQIFDLAEDCAFKD